MKRKWVVSLVVIGAILLLLSAKTELKSETALLQKKIFLKIIQLRRITSIKLVQSFSANQVDLIVTGRTGAAFITQTGSLKRFVRFSERGGTVVPIDPGNDNIWEFMNRGGGWQPVSLFNHKGDKLWEYDPAFAPNDMACGDLDGDGKIDFVVGLNGSDGLHLLDENGNVRWKQEASNVQSVEVVDTDNDGHPEIVHSNGGGQNLIVVRNIKGEILRQWKTGFAHFSLCHWPDSKSDFYILGMVGDNNIQLMDFKGQLVAEFRVPRTGRAAHATPFYFKGKNNPFFVVVVSFLASSHRSVLYLFDEKRDLLFYEEFESTEPSIAMLRSKKTADEILLVGADGGIVWQYTPNVKALGKALKIAANQKENAVDSKKIIAHVFKEDISAGNIGLALEIDKYNAVKKLTGIIIKKVSKAFIQENGLEATDEELEEYIDFTDRSMEQRKKQSKKELAEVDKKLKSSAIKGVKRKKLEKRRDSLLRIVNTFEQDDESKRKQKLKDKQIRIFLAQWVEKWKMFKALFEKYGGIVQGDKFGPVPVGALRKLLKDYEEKGHWTIFDKKLKELFWEQINKKPKIIIPPDKVDFTPFWKKPVQRKKK